MTFCLLSEAPSSAIHLLYYAQTQGVKFSDVIMVGDGGERYWILKDYATINKFNLFFVPGPNDKQCQELLENINPKYLVIMVSKKVLPNILGAVKNGLVINPHPGVLPKYRGRDCRRWAVLDDGEVGVSSHVVDGDFDTGDIINIKTLEIKPGDTIETISERNYYQNKWQCLVEALLQLEQGTAVFRKQRKGEGRRYYQMPLELRKVVDEKLKGEGNNVR